MICMQTPASICDRMLWFTASRSTRGSVYVLHEGSLGEGLVYDRCTGSVMLQAVGHHAMAAGQRSDLEALLCNPSWLEHKLHAYGVACIVADFRRCHAVLCHHVLPPGSSPSKRPVRQAVMNHLRRQANELRQLTTQWLCGITVGFTVGLRSGSSTPTPGMAPQD